MIECWLKPNRRALAMGTVLPVAALAVGGLLIVRGERSPLGVAALLVGGSLCLLGLVMLAGLLRHLVAPRIGYRSGKVLFFLRATGPIEVPIEVVEAFLLGEASAGAAGRSARVKTATVNVRLAESATEWREREVSGALGTWRDGYISILGTWCEPLSVDLISGLNQRLTCAKRQWEQAESDRMAGERP